MLPQLRAARENTTYDRKLACLADVYLLGSDDMGLYPPKHGEPTDLKETIHLQYEAASTIITCNCEVSEWYAMVGDELLTSAAMDRLLPDKRVVVMAGDSYRNPPTKAAAQATR